MSYFTSFAVAGGSGRVGRAIVAGLVAAGAAKVTVLSRFAETKIEGATAKAVDFNSVESVQAALDGAEVVISALSGQALGHQPVLAQAAKSAGARLFIPSEYGTASCDFGPGTLYYPKRLFLNHLKQLGLPSLAVANGVFAEMIFTSPVFGMHYPSGKAHIVGSPDTAASFVTMPDLGSFLGQLLTSLPASQLTQLGQVAVEGSHSTTAQTIAYYEKSHPGSKVELTTTSIDEAEAALKDKEGMDLYLSTLKVLFAQGFVDVTRGGERGTSNHLVPGWKPITVEEFLGML